MKNIIIILSTMLLASCGQAMGKWTETTNEKVYLSRWEGERELSGRDTSLNIYDRFAACFPDMKMGRYVEERNLLPQEIAEEFLPDLFDMGDVDVKIYAVGKITGYKGMDLFVCDYEGERPDEESYDNHTDSHRWILMFDEDDHSPVLTTGYDGNMERAILTMAFRYYGEGGESEYRSWFDADTTVIARNYVSESESATGYNTPIVSDREYRWAIGSNGEKEILEITKLEFSSPFYDRNWLNEQNWDDVEDEGFNRVYPTREDMWPLFQQQDDDGISLYFYITRLDSGELMPIFHTRDAGIIDFYYVGDKESLKIAKKSSSKQPGLFNITIKTSDGDLGLLPHGMIVLLI